MYPNMRNNYMENSMNMENYYPEIYKIINPMIIKTCSQMTGPVTKETIENMTEIIYSNVEGQSNIDVNINIKQNKNGDVKNPNSKEEKREVRGPNYLLKDLITILLLKELERHNHRPPFPPPPPRPRPPFPGPMYNRQDINQISPENYNPYFSY